MNTLSRPLPLASALIAFSLNKKRKKTPKTLKPKISQLPGQRSQTLQTLDSENPQSLLDSSSAGAFIPISKPPTSACCNQRPSGSGPSLSPAVLSLSRCASPPRSALRHAVYRFAVDRLSSSQPQTDTAICCPHSVLTESPSSSLSHCSVEG